MSKNSRLLPVLAALVAACCVSTPAVAAADAACQPIFDAATKIFAGSNPCLHHAGPPRRQVPKCRGDLYQQRDIRHLQR